MVLRRGRKFNTASGRTLRYHSGDPGCGGLSGFCGQSVILKSRNVRTSERHVKDFATCLDDGGLENTINGHGQRDVVLYSMNKRKRWLLPDLLAESIADSGFHGDVDYGVVMVERYLTQSYTDSNGNGPVKHLADCRAVRNSRLHGDDQIQHSHREARKAFSFEKDLRTKEAARDRRAELKKRRQERARTGIRIDVAPRRRPNRWARHAQNPIPETAEVRYEVIRPKPSNQFPWHSERKMKHKRERQMFAHRTQGQLFKISRKTNHGDDLFGYDIQQRLQHRGMCYDMSEDASYLMEDEDDYELQLTEDYESDPICSADGTSRCLGEFIVHNPTGSKRRQRKEKGFAEAKDSCDCETDDTVYKGRLPSGRRYGKGCAIYCPEEDAGNSSTRFSDKDLDAKSTNSEWDTLDSGFESDGVIAPSGSARSDVGATYLNDLSDVHTTSSDDLTVTWLDLGSVLQAAIHPDALKDSFGPEHKEGGMQPRRFSIALKARSTNEVPVLATAVFDVSSNLQGAATDKVDLRLRVCGSDIPFHDMHHSLMDAFGIQEKSFSMPALMEKLQHVLSMHARSHASVATKVSPCREPDVTMETVHDMMGWTFTCSTVEEVKTHLHDEQMLSVKDYTHNDSCSISSHNDEQEESCGICFEPLAPSLGEGVTGMALMHCGHWFCEECWVHHVSSRTRMNEPRILCPAFKCGSVIDSTTLLSLMPDSLVRLHLTRCLDDRISQHPQWRWCPVSQCGRLVRVGRGGRGRHPGKTPGDNRPCGNPLDPGVGVGVTSSKPLGLGAGVRVGVPVSCECGTNWCSECKEEAHWPATCKQAAKHVEYMQKEIASDKAPSIRTVEVKRCKACDHPMEKNGGCMQMTCRCGHSFCWECLAAWSDHDFFSWPYRCPKPQQQYETVALSKRNHGTLVLTELAMENRRLNRLDAILGRRKAALRLATTMFLHTAATIEDADRHPCMCDEDRGAFDHRRLLTYTKHNQGRYCALLKRARQFAAFTSEVHAVLEYLSVLVAMVPRRTRLGWRVMLSRLMFIACRMEELMKRNRGREAEDAWRSLVLLHRQGMACLKDITRTIPLVHQRLGGRGQRSKGSWEEVV